MKIKLFGDLRQKAGFSEKACSGETLRAALEDICADNQALRAAIFDSADLQPHVRVMVNGQDSELVQGLDTAISAGDQIAVFPPIAGG
ncbi:MAG: MoaD family protein [Anaerolineales bacterium]|nr:MoaD family protein [Anaerolineales bacterium]